MQHEDFRLRLLSLCSELPDEQFQELIFRFEALNLSLEKFVSLLACLNPYLSNPIGETQTQMDALCHGCARRCSRYSETINECSDYYQFVEEKCLSCEFWDVERCMRNKPCLRGEGYSKILEEEAKSRMGMDV